MTDEMQEDFYRWRAKAEIRADRLRMLHDWLKRDGDTWDRFVSEYPYVETAWFDSEDKVL